VAKTTLTRLFLAILLLTAPTVVEGASGRASVLKDLHLSGPVAGDAVVFGADLYLEKGAEVSGDAIAIGGSVMVSSGAVVDRHVIAVFGCAEITPPADVGGRVLAYSSLVALASNSATGRPMSANFSMRLLAAGGWLLVTTGLAFLFPIRLRYGTWATASLGFRVPVLGVVLSVTLFAAIIATMGLGPVMGVPLVATMMILFFVAKAVGLTVLGCWLGGAVLKRWLAHPLPMTLEVFVGVLVFLALRFLPAAGELLWALISMTALGASVAVIGVSLDGARAEA
jgi:hypothetical protein